MRFDIIRNGNKNSGVNPHSAYIEIEESKGLSALSFHIFDDLHLAHSWVARDLSLSKELFPYGELQFSWVAVLYIYSSLIGAAVRT